MLLNPMASGPGGRRCANRVMSQQVANNAADTDVHKPEKLAHLRQLIAAAEQRAPVIKAPVQDQAGASWQSGVAEIDTALPDGCFNRTGVHEVSGASHGETATASAYLAALLKQLFKASQGLPRRQVLWCQTHAAAREFGLLQGAGLRAFGLDPAQFLFVHTAKNTDVLWALEEGARAATLLAVVGEIDTMSFTHSRRLTLAAAAGATPVLVLRPHHDKIASAADTRWQIGANPSAGDPFAPEAPGNLQWHVALTRCRGGKSGVWDVEWFHETHRFRLAQQLSSRLPRVAELSSRRFSHPECITTQLPSVCTGS